ncbi:MAG: nitrate/sulfonate/bicarbonate ABC transporter ATP-binding protein [Bryobacterales bacterium]|nr:nitrate/sulfonate/bicarbonate ABC transporter ATP-binding protein [Bryobacterales bacterium]
MEAIIEARQVERLYLKPGGDSVRVIAPTDLTILPGKIYALLGPSGSGKSSLLRMLSGLAQPSRGEIIWHGQPLDGRMPEVSIVFQSFALFPWLTVIGNVEAPLRARGVTVGQRRERALRMLDIVGLDGFEAAYPKELSGGMKQRVGFARALVVEPELLFMDEPFSALDVLTAESLRGELLELWLDKKIPTRAIFMVTHNIEEAVFLADHIVVLGGRPAQIAAEFEVRLAHPRNRKAEPFLSLVDEIYKILTGSRPPPSGATVSTEGAEQSAPRKHQVLPHARPGGVAGLLEILTDRGGRDDLYRLAGTLAMEVDDLLPIVEAAALLGFIRLQEGDAEITAEGTEFARADILNRKVLFRHTAVERVTLLRQIQQALRSKADHTLPKEFFIDVLDQHFGPEEAERQFMSAVDWGRYAELFEYDAGSGNLILAEG